MKSNPMVGYHNSLNNAWLGKMLWERKLHDKFYQYLCGGNSSCADVIWNFIKFC